MLNVYSKGQHIAAINKAHKCSDNYAPMYPWLLLHNTGRVDRFCTLSEARNDALKLAPAVKFSRA